MPGFAKYITAIYIHGYGEYAVRPAKLKVITANCPADL